jgi:hypothetical protein
MLNQKMRGAVMLRLFYGLLVAAAFGLGWSLTPPSPQAARAADPLLPSVQQHKITVQTDLVIGLGVKCASDVEHNVTVCRCAD